MSGRGGEAARTSDCPLLDRDRYHNMKPPDAFIPVDIQEMELADAAHPGGGPKL